MTDVSAYGANVEMCRNLTLSMFYLVTEMSVEQTVAKIAAKVRIEPKLPL
ncbi:hypothetical protein ACFFUT_13245 [Pseudohalocynthiibacter aestuariivivens]|jgi:hypothetical protein|uniref:Uncharacterized protein n=1 Tax=Pseudohalocynthiibacter aestuariivivens TaxID=1591409 RepID=A0ABV5JJS4_9RHOB|nr:MULTISPECIES: hypothetical protein [Pseudohalocynthiibacter]MBS9718441.1 hypothetical protein [Pseudohalocynthiibacter aestuariivivens]MCK0104090.1 hypothetical protein [Pseudohalocynthiibacter sp. F2068]